MSENDKITEETANDTLPAEVETDLAEQETDVMPAEPEEEEIGLLFCKVGFDLGQIGRAHV